MTTLEAKKVLSKYIKQCKTDNDSYCIVHFSKKEDKYKGLTDMDAGDALLIIHELVTQYNLLPEAVFESLK